jgi:hypothetical protein
MRVAMALAVLAAPGSLLQLYAICALRWEVAVIQVVAVFLVTVLRAIARRDLVLDPPNFKVTDTQELASLVISISAAKSNSLQSSDGIKKWAQEMQNTSATGYRWELVTSQLCPSRQGGRVEATVKTIANSQASVPSWSSIQWVEKPPRTMPVGPLVEVERFNSAAKEVPHLVRPDVITVADNLVKALEGVAEILSTEGPAYVCWRAHPIFGVGSTNYFKWKIQLAHGEADQEGAIKLEPLAFYFKRVRRGVGTDLAQYDWVLQNPTWLRAVLSLWLSRLGGTRPGSDRRAFKDEDLYKPQECCRIV